MIVVYTDDKIEVFEEFDFLENKMDFPVASITKIASFAEDMQNTEENLEYPYYRVKIEHSGETLQFTKTKLWQAKLCLIKHLMK